MSVKAANAEALRRLGEAQPVLVDCRPAAEALSLEAGTVLHAGPPIAWDAMCPMLQGAVVGALRHEGWAVTDGEAARMAARGDVRFEPCHHRGAVGPMTGLITPSMPVFVVEERTFGARAAVTINEGLGRVLRFGASDAPVLERLAWLRDEAGPLLGRTLRRLGGLELRPLMGQALWMGDEMHQRNVAASSLFVRALLPALVREAAGPALARLVDFIAGNDQFFLNLAMAAAKAAAEPALAVPRASVVATMARNGTEFGIRVGGCGSRWFTAPVNTPDGLFFPGFGPPDANPDIGDSAIVETVGLGGMAMAASPAVARFVGAGGLAEALRITDEMREITLGEHPHFRIPAQQDRGAPLGIDVRRVVATGITPLINTGIAGRKPGTGQVGAGVVRAPLGCFTAALEALATRLAGDTEAGGAVDA
ncbi:MAG TPA: DUF1116 domain-containing protein [Methylomirabilota bacterium]|jgi:hypothetical protein|nr:DUF1116 domain-containing protein [Methylomirabilota bacterium]